MVGGPRTNISPFSVHIPLTQSQPFQVLRRSPSFTNQLCLLHSIHPSARSIHPFPAQSIHAPPLNALAPPGAPARR
eukprot:6177431-Pleurochrysis_carterae.AAC.3